MKSARIVRAGIRFRNALLAALFAGISSAAIALLSNAVLGRNNRSIEHLVLVLRIQQMLLELLALLGVCLAVYSFIQFFMGANDLIKVNEIIDTATARKEYNAHLKTSQDVNKMAPEEAVSKTTFVPYQDNSGPLESRAMEEIGDTKVRCIRCKVSVFVGPSTQNFICHNCKTKQKVGW